MSKDSSAKYSHKNEERLQKKKTSWKCQDLSKGEKHKKREFGHKQYKSLPQHEKQRLVAYRKK